MTEAQQFATGDRVVPHEVNVRPLVDMGMITERELEVARRGGVVTAVITPTMVDVAWQDEHPRRTSTDLLQPAPHAQPSGEVLAPAAETSPPFPPAVSRVVDLFRREVTALAEALRAARDTTGPLPVAQVNRLARDAADAAARVATLYAIAEDDADAVAAMDAHLRENGLTLS